MKFLFTGLLFFSLNAVAGIDTTGLHASFVKAKSFSFSNPDSARQYNKSGLELARKARLTSFDHIYYYNAGLINYATGNFDTAIIEICRSLALKSEIKDLKGIAGCYNNLGLIYGDKGKFKIAIEYYFKSLKLKEALNDKKGQASTSGNIGMIYENQADYPKAEKWYLESMKLFQEIGDQKGVASAFNNLAPIYFSRGQIDKALDFMFRSLNLKSSLNDVKGIGSSCGNIGTFYLEYLNRDPKKDSISVFVNHRGLVKLSASTILDSSMIYQQRAFKIQDGLGDQRGKVYSLIGIGNIYNYKKDYASAVKVFTDAETIALSLGTLKKLKDIYSGLYTAQKNTQQYSAALASFEKFKALSDTLFSKENSRKIAAEEARFQYEKKEQQAKLEQERKEFLYNESLKRKNLLLYSSGGGIILTLVLCVLIFKNLRQKKAANALLEEKNSIIEEKNKDIISSIEYARKIQDAFLPDLNTLRAFLPGSFIFYQPKDIVAGDFYFFHKSGDQLILAVADCTGHGVPGGFMSMLGHQLLSEIIIQKKVCDPGMILTELNKGVRMALNQHTGSSRDGMDISLVRLVMKPNGVDIQYAGANLQLLYIKQNSTEVSFLKGDKSGIGGHTESNFGYAVRETSLSTGDRFFLFTDGYADQFGGNASSKGGKKFKLSQLKELLLKLEGISPDEQKAFIGSVFNNWKGNLEQTDDVTVLGCTI